MVTLSHPVKGKPAWVITKSDLDIYHQILRLDSGPARYATKQRALMFIDQMRAEGRAGKSVFHSYRKTKKTLSYL